MKEHKYVVRGPVQLSEWVGECQNTLNKYEAEAWFDEINELLDGYGRDNLAEYIWDDSCIKGVISSIVVGIERVQENNMDMLCSRTEVISSRELSEDQKEKLLDYITGQFRYGYGEGLEQQEMCKGITTDLCEEWDPEKQEYYMEEYVVDTYMNFYLWFPKDFELVFVDPKAVSAPLKPRKPKCKLIGEDGNIFNLIGIASRELRRAGMRDEAREMSEKCMKSKSYSEALAVISNYVEVQ